MAAAAASGDRPLGWPWRDAFLIEDGVTFLNHGSFGATPRVVHAAAQTWRDRMEAQPVRFFARELEPALRAAADRLARFLGARDGSLVFLDNATTGVNTVLRSARLAPGDEILFTSHAYGAVAQAIRFTVSRTGATAVEVAIPCPVTDEDQIVAAVAAALTAHTKIAVFDHVTSPSAVVMPLSRLIVAARQAGAMLLIDGAHAPGQLALDIEELGVDWYVGNAHKWLYAPKGCGFLWASESVRDALHPLVISHGLGRGFLAEFDWTGTRDYSPWLAVTAALDFVEELGPETIRHYNRALADEAARLLSAAWGTPVSAPQPLRGAMAAVRVPGDAEASPQAARALHDRLWDGHRIEVPIIPFADALWARVSAQVYNQRQDYERLAEALACP